MKLRNAMRPIISWQLLRSHRHSLQMILILHRWRKRLLLVPNGRRCARRSGTESSTSTSRSLSQTLRPLSPSAQEPECEERADNEGDTDT
jgi:hypothetical protein